MKSAVKEPKIIKRKIGERVNVHLGFEPDLTKDLGDGIVEAIVTTSSVDRTNENILTTGIDTTGFMATGGPVLYGHDYQSLPIGKTIKLTEMKNKIKAQFQMAVEEYDFAATVYALIKGGYLNAVSIGGIVREWSEDYRTIMKMDMVEFSVVPVPANDEAIITSRSLEKMTGKSIDTIKTEFEDFNRRVMVDKLKTMGQDDINQAVGVLELLVATLKASITASAGDAETPEVKRIKRVRLVNAAKAVNQESERVIRVIKFKQE